MGSLKRFYFFLGCLALFLMSCAASKHTGSPSNLQAVIDSVRETYAPDKRTALFDITANGGVLDGETNLPEAKNKLLSALDRDHIPYTDSIRVLPDPALHGNIFAIVSISVANLRAKPGHPFEMVTQATLGTPVNVLRKEKGWYLVQTPDKYIAWTESGGIRLMNKEKRDQWQAMKKVIYVKPYGFAYTGENTDTQTISDLVYGDVLAFQKEKDGFTETLFPDGRIGYIPSPEIMTYKAWTASRQPTQENLVSASKKLMGIPYLWGGTSFKGVDCSGFTRTLYFMNGLILPRDASQQVKIGDEIDTRDGWHRLQPGDLLFFGIPARDGKPERVIHVGMWLGGEHDEFIQSASRVKISSFDPSAPNYDETELHRFLRAKRITPQNALFDLRTATLYE